MSIRLCRIAALAAAVCVFSVASVRPASAEPIAYDVSADFATGWTTYSCGDFGLLTCFAPVEGHQVTIVMSDGTMDHFSLRLEAAPTVGVLPVGLRFAGLDGTGASLQMLVDGSVYPGTGYPFIWSNGAVRNDLDLSIIVPDGFRYIVNGTATDVTMRVASVPEPGSLVLFGTGALVLVGRRFNRQSRRG